MFKKRELSARKLIKRDFEVSTSYFEEGKALGKLIDPANVLGYSMSDLDRAKRDLLEARSIIMSLGFFLDPHFIKGLFSKNRITGPVFEKVELAEIQAGALASLNSSGLFREALNRAHEREKTTD